MEISGIFGSDSGMLGLAQGLRRDICGQCVFLLDGGVMNRQYNENLERTVRLAEALLSLADEGDAAREDVGCGILYGTVRDSAYRIRSLAASEIAEHKRAGRWSV